VQSGQDSPNGAKTRLVDLTRLVKLPTVIPP
jgi:hypothetical protein